MNRVFRRQHKGQSIVILALGMIALLGFVGITTDISLLFVRYATLRRAVDAAAIAAAGQMRQDRSIATVSLTARSYIEFHGLNPRDVWVEACQNQPRVDNDPGTPGLQNAPPAVVNSYDAYNSAYVDLFAAIQGNTLGLSGLRDTYVTNANAYIAVMESAATGIPPAALPLQANAQNLLTAYAGYPTDPQISANLTATNQAVLDYIQALSEAVPPDWTDDLEICTAEQRKLVRVTAQVYSPTVFLRLFGWQDILLEASAVSETAVLDVVIVMDVSESMLFDTTIQDWEAVHMAVAYLPPRLESVGTVNGFPAQFLADVDNNVNNDTVLSLLIDDNVNNPRNVNQEPIPIWTNGVTSAETRRPNEFSTTLDPIQYPGLVYTPPPARVNGGNPVVNGYADTYETWVDGWFWGYFHLGVPQSEVNKRLYYLDVGQSIGGTTSLLDRGLAGTRGSPLGTPAPATANTDFDQIRNQFYQVRSFIPDGIANPAGQSHPREACRVRFYPFSMILTVPPDVAEMYVDEFGLTNTDWAGIQNFNTPTTLDDAKWSGFVPTYDFYGCCNDPSRAFVDRNGDFFVDAAFTIPFAPNPDNWDNDGLFNDLVCEPMKQARDATRLFLERVDFLRGDRVGFVTFDKAAYIIDPDGKNGPTTAGAINRSHMIEELPEATRVLNNYIGVRAEENYYVWNEDGGGWIGYAAGFNQQNDVIPVNYDCTLADCPPPPMESFTAPEVSEGNNIDASYLNYPVRGNCSIQNAELQFPYSRFATRNVTGLEGTLSASLIRIMNPAVYGTDTDPFWQGYNNTRTPRLDTGHSYEKQGTCRGTNIGAALRVGNDALTDPRTTRRAGTVWIMILLSDGAAGASDPVRAQGSKINQAAPYQQVSRFDWRTVTVPPAPPAPANTPNLTNQYGRGIAANTAILERGDYGWLGLCPLGTPSNPGRLVTGDGKAFPYCSDTDVFSRHFCLTLAGRSVGYPDFGPGFAPGSKDEDYRDRLIAVAEGETFDPPAGIVPAGWATFDENVQTEGQYILDQNTRFGNIFDVDLGDQDAVGNSCQVLYDVDDYARDWADYVAGVDEDQSGDAVLPTIFAIGFRLQFEDSPHGSDNRTCAQRHGGPGVPAYDRCMCNLNIEQCLGEELLRYIADAGDNFIIDNDLQQDWRDHEGETTNILLDKSVDDWGPKDPCENPNISWSDPGVSIADFAPRAGGESCGNYYNEPSVTELQQVFDDIASRMFTRLAG
jgi:hypothetical protein